MPKMLKVGFDEDVYGTVTERGGNFVFDGPNADAVKHFAEVSARAIASDCKDESELTCEAVMNRMAEVLQGRAWATWVADESAGNLAGDPLTALTAPDTSDTAPSSSAP